MPIADLAAPRPPPDAAWPRNRPLSLDHVVVRRGSSEILRGVDLVFEPGRRYVVVGPSGAGKSTLLRLLNRLEDPSQGAVLCGDTPLAKLPVRAVRRGVGLVFQASRLLAGTVAENLRFPFEVRALARPGSAQLEAALDEVGLPTSWLERDSAALSGGERQRLALAMALAADPEVLALDEPTAALDPSSARQLIDLLANRAIQTGLRTIAVCHQREHAAWLGDVAVVLTEGRVTDLGPTAEVLARTDAHLWESPPSVKDDA
jgi:putative ABC transport system ATP-binding protein